MSAETTQDPWSDVDFAKLEKSLRRGRTLFSWSMSGIVGVLTVIASLPLFSVIFMLLYRGAQRLSISLFTQTPPAGLEEGGGIGNAILGTLAMVGIASAISVPFGILAAMILAEFAPDSVISAMVRFCAKVLTGFPSILAGVFVYAILVVTTGNPSALAGGVALSILMIPTVMLTAEESIKMVPRKMKEAAVGMGCTSTQVAWKVLLPTAMPGILTGVMLAVARAAGETAPLLFTARFAMNSWLIDSSGFYPMEPTASLAVLIYNFSGSPYSNQVEVAWAASLMLVVLVLFFNVLGQSFQKRSPER